MVTAWSWKNVDEDDRDFDLRVAGSSNSGVTTLNIRAGLIVWHSAASQASSTIAR